MPFAQPSKQPIPDPHLRHPTNLFPASSHHLRRVETAPRRRRERSPVTASSPTTARGHQRSPTRHTPAATIAPTATATVAWSDDTATDVVAVDSSAGSRVVVRGPTPKVYMSASQRSKWKRRYAHRLRQSIRERSMPGDHDDVGATVDARGEVGYLNQRNEDALTSVDNDDDDDVDDDDDDDDVDALSRVYKMLNDSSLPDSELFYQLPRPSLVVPDIWLGQRLDAGMTPAQREAHIRRIRATTLRVDNYDAQGLLMFISSTTRQHYGLDDYSHYLVPPPNERELKTQRVPKKLLSHYYRGKLLARRFSSKSRYSISVAKRRRKGRGPCARRSRGASLRTRARIGSSVQGGRDGAQGISEAINLEDGDEQEEDVKKSSELSDGDIHDYEYWCPSPVFQEAEQRRTQLREELAREVETFNATKRARSALGEITDGPRKRRKSYALDSAKEIAQLSNTEIVWQLLAEERSDSEGEHSDRDCDAHRSSLSPAKSQRDSDDSPQKDAVRRERTEKYKDEEDNDVIVIPEPEQPKNLMSMRPPIEEKQVEVPLFDDLFHTLLTDPKKITSANNTDKEPVKEEQIVDRKPHRNDDDDKDNMNKNNINNNNGNKNSTNEIGEVSIIDRDTVRQVSASTTKKGGKKLGDGKKDGGIPGFDPARHMRGFKKEQWLADAFSGSLFVKKPKPANSSVASTTGSHQMEHQCDDRVKEEPKLNRTDTGAPSRAWDMMKKMGFKNRLGLNEDGITEPVPMSKRIDNDRRGVGVVRRLVSNFPEKASHPAGPAAPRPSEQAAGVHGKSNTKTTNSVEGVRDYAEEMAYEARQRKRHSRGDRREETSGRRANGRNTLDDADLDPDDEYETEVDGDIVSDNGRRGVVLDFNILVCNARARQRDVLDHVRKQWREIDNFDLDAIIKRGGRDLSDAQIAHKLLQHMRRDEDEEGLEFMLELLDNAYECVAGPMLNLDVASMLKYWSRRWRLCFGLLHRGSARRMRAECEALGLERLSEGVRFGVVNPAEEWPFVGSMHALLRRLGMTPAQTLVLMEQQGRRNSGSLTAGCVAARVLGARTLCLSSKLSIGNPDLLVPMHKVVHGLDMMNGIVHVTLDDLIDKQKVVVDHIICSQPFKRMLRHRVLALRASDGQYHCGVVEIGHGSSQNGGESLIMFYPSGEHEWVQDDWISPANRRVFRILLKNGFPSLLAPEDIDML